MQLQTQLNVLTEKNHELEGQMPSLNSSLTALTKKHEELLEKFKNIQDDLVDKQESFKIEMATQERLASLYRMSFEQVKPRIAQLEENAQLAHLHHIQEKETLEEALSTANGQISDLMSIMQEKEYQMGCLQQSFSILEKHDGEGSLNGGFDVESPKAKAIQQFMKSQPKKTFAQVLAENIRLQNDLDAEKKECERVKGCLAEICQDIEDRAPTLKKNQEEHGELKKTLHLMSQDLESLMSKNQTLSIQVINKLQKFMYIYMYIHVEAHLNIWCTVYLARNVHCNIVHVTPHIVILSV